jgi:RHS repeat-associated protein
VVCRTNWERTSPSETTRGPFTWRYYLHNGIEFGPEIDLGPEVTSSCLSDRTLTLDYNGDGATDLLIYNYSERDGFDNSFYAAVILTTIPATIIETNLQHFGDLQPITRILDVNGDGLQDVALTKSWAQPIQVWINTGNGFIGGYEGLPGLQDDGGQYTWSFYRAQVMDYDGDGRDDLLVPVKTESTCSPNACPGQNQIGHWAILRSTGERFDFSRRQEFAFQEINLGIPYWPYNNQRKFRGYGYQRPVVFDANGDTLPDVTLVDHDRFVIYRHRGEVPNLIVKIRDGLIGVSPVSKDWKDIWTYKINYRSLTDPSVYSRELRFSKYNPGCSYPLYCSRPPILVVSQHWEDNGGGIVPVSPSEYRYTYHDARFDHLGYGFLGFGERSVRYMDTGELTIARFDNYTYASARYPYRGLPLQQTRRVQLGSGSSRKFRISRVVNDYRFLSLNRGQTYFPYLQKRKEEVYETRDLDLDDNDRLSETETSVTIDNFGNVTNSLIDLGNGYKHYSYYRYTNNSQLWLLGLLEQSSERSTTPEETQLRLTWYSYNRDTGALEKEEVEPLRQNQKLTINYERDKAGNIIKTTTQDATGNSRESIVDYDDEKLFPIRFINSLGHTLARTYNRGFGTATEERNPNNLITRWYYDKFGRLIREIRPDGTETTISLYKVMDSSERSHLEVRERTFGLSDTRRVLDRLGRPVEVISSGFQGQKIYQSILYDQVGRVKSITSPTRVGQTFIGRTRYDYDEMGRLRYIYAPDESVIEYRYDGLNSYAIDPKGNVSQIQRNHLGQIIKTIDAYSSETNYTRYAYGPFGSLRSVIDSDGNTTDIISDQYGHTLRLVDPDLGLRQYEYNSFGELIKSIDGNRKETFFAYDALGRLRKQKSFDGISGWTYDQGENSIGLISEIQSPEGSTEHYFYDGKGRLKTIETTIRNQKFSQNIQYDDFGRVDTIKYPNLDSFEPFEIRYIYDDTGFPKEIREKSSNYLYWQALELNSLNQVTQEYFGNSVKTNRKFDLKNGRQLSISSVNTQASDSSPLQSISYKYDKNGNLVNRHDKVERAYEVFEYDKLDRLTVSKACYENFPSRCFSIKNNEYDNIGNLIFKSDVGPYIYGSEKPHAVTQAGNNRYQYDENGNQVARPTEVIEYTAFNKLRQIVDVQGKKQHFEYDASQDRILKETEQELTFYVGGSYEMTRSIDNSGEENLTQSYYVRLGNRVIAVVRRIGSNSSDVQTKVAYLHDDNLGSTDVITDETGNILQRLSFDAFGRNREPNWSGSPAPVNQSGVRFGFTGHEHDGKLVNMKGREYDPQLGRFLTPDPYVSSPLYSQSLNRYSYVLNNPLSLIDPTGFEECSICNFDDDYDPYENIPFAGTMEPFIVTGSRVDIEPNISAVVGDFIPDYDSGLSPEAQSYLDGISAYYKGDFAGILQFSSESYRAAPMLLAKGDPAAAFLYSIPFGFLADFLEDSAADLLNEAAQENETAARIGSGIGYFGSHILSLLLGPKGTSLGGKAPAISTSVVGNPAAIARNLGKLSTRQSDVLNRLANEGDRVIVPRKTFSLRDLAALTAETGDEFAMFTTGGRRLVVRGSKGTVPITPTMASEMAKNGWRWSAHTHPGMTKQVLRSSPGDRAVLNSFSRNQGESAILNSNGEVSRFTTYNDLLSGWRP